MRPKGRTTVDLRRSDRVSGVKMFESEEYWVEEYPQPSFRLVVARKDSAPVEGEQAWYDLWSIKNQVWGDEALAVEVYPPRSCLVDGQNQRHLWKVTPRFDVSKASSEFCPRS
jgi:hypothetical protein